MVEIGKFIQQTEGYKAFIPNAFPPKEKMIFPDTIIYKQSEAMRLLGELDGITKLLPDRDWFILMFLRKDASSSSQIEGTNATMMDLVERENTEPSANLPQDVDDILHYLYALDYGLKRIQDFPFSLRFIRELHEKLMRGARATQSSFPGEFRTSQNWIGGRIINEARFVPPTVPEMKRALGDLEKFINEDKNSYLPLVKAALIHAQFETIHPFNDGNGRTGRMLITIYFWYKGILRMPILYLSSYFKKYQKVYYEKVDGYCYGKVEEWVNFFLDGVIEIAKSSISICEKITELREKDMQKIQTLNRTASESTMKVLKNLYKMPIVGIADIIKWTEYSRPSAYKMVERLCNMEILEPMKKGDDVYAQKWIYRKYWELFDDSKGVHE